MKPKYLTLNDSLYTYLCGARTAAHDPVLTDLRTETEALGDEARMQISQEQGSFISLLVAAMGARTALEVGTFTGYSSVCIARGLPTHGKLICLDQSAEWTAVARRYWIRTGVDDKIELRLGDAIPLLRQLEPELRFDFVFIDAEKTQYDAYYELILPRVRPNGLIMFDNMLWGGRVNNAPSNDPSAQAIKALNRKLSNDARVEAVLLPLADGVTLCRRRE